MRSKTFSTLFQISGRLDGSFRAAINAAQNAMKGLTRAERATAGMRANPLTSRLEELNRLQKMMQRYQQMQSDLSRGKLGRGEFTAMQEAARYLKAAGYGVDQMVQSMMRLKMAAKETSDALRRISDASKNLSEARAASNNASSNLSNEWNNMSNAVSTAQSIMQPFKSAVDNAETFEHAMSKVKALTQSENIKAGNYERVREEMAELEAQARQLGATTQFTMTQAAEAQGYLGMAGWSKDQIIKAMPGMLDLAAASGMDLARTADIVSDNLTALGLDASQVGHMTDVYAYALTRSNLNMEALGESMKYAAPAMHAYGGDIHDAAAAMMIMGNAGIKGSMAGTALRMGLLRLAGPPKKASKEMEALGVSLSDATRMAYESQAQLEALGIHTDANMKPTEKMAYVLRELSTKMQGLSKDEKLAAVGAIFGVNAASGWLAVLEQGPEAFEKFRNELRTSDGTAKQVATTMNDDTRGAWLYLESAIDAVSNNVGSAFLPALKSIYEGLNPVVTSMAEWIGEHPGVVQGMGAIAAAIAGGMVALGGFRLALAGINFASTTIDLMKATAAFNALTGTTGIAASAFGRLSTILAAFSAGGFAAGFKALGSAAMAALTGIGTAMKGLLLNPWVLGITVALMLLAANWDKVSASASAAWEVMSKVFGRLGEGLGTIFDGIKGALESSGLMSALESVLDKLGLIEKKKSVLDQRESLPQEMSEMVSGELRLESDELDELTRSTRSILRNVEGKTNEEIAEEIWSKMSSEKQTDAAQRQQAEMLREELSRRKDISDESREAIESLINERQYAARESAIEPLVKKFDELAGKQDLKSESDRNAFLSMAKEALSKEEGLGAGEREEIYGRLKAGVDERRAASSYSEELKELTSGASLKTLSEQSEMVSKVLNETSGSAASMSTRFEEFGQWLKGQEQLSQSARETMAAEYREGLQEQMTARLSEGISAALSKANESDKVSALTELISSQKDQSALAVEMMMKSVESGLKKSGYEGDDVKALLSEVSLGVKEAVSAREKSEAASSYAEAPKLPDVKVEVKPTAGLNPYEYRPWEMQMGAMSSAAAEREYAVQSGASASMFEMLSNLLFSKTEASTPSGAEELNASTAELSAAISAAAAEQSAASSQVNTSTVEMTAGLTQVNVTAQATGVELQNVGMNGQLASQGMQQVSDGSMQASASVIALAGSTDGAQAGMAAVAGASSSASGALGGLGAAASSAISALMSAASSAGSAVMNAASSARAALSSLFSGGEPAHNAVGGIYPRGEFLTTFAEDSAEAAIPIKRGDSNAISLWQRTGAMLGVLGGQHSMSNGYISAEMARAIGQYSPEVRKSKSYESLVRAKRPRTFIDKLIDGGSQNPSMMKSGGLFGGISPMMSALPSMEQSSESLSSKLQTYDQLEQQTMSLSTTTNNDQSMPPITLNFHFNGNVNREDVQRGVEESLPSIRETFEQQMAKYRHEVSRRSF